MASDSFSDVMARLQGGDKDAAAAIFGRFVQRLVALARSRLDTRIRQKEDPEDVVQSVFRSFFTRHSLGEFEIGDWDSLWSLLALITLRKCGNRIQHFHRARRSIQDELHVDESAESRAAWSVIARDPTPAEAAMLAETLEKLMRDFDENERLMLSLRLQDYTIPEISERVGRAERTVRRLLERLRKRLQRMQEDEED